MTARDELFWAKVRRTDDCWEWAAAKDQDGYGMFWDGSRTVRAHRFSFELALGPVPAGLRLDHLCRNTSCVRPEHLEVVTHQVNQLRSTSFSGTNAAKTHCKNGHPFDEVNTRARSDHPGRVCRTCIREAVRRHRERIR